MVFMNYFQIFLGRQASNMIQFQLTSAPRRETTSEIEMLDLQGKPIKLSRG